METDDFDQWWLEQLAHERDPITPEHREYIFGCLVQFGLIPPDMNPRDLELHSI